MLALAEAACDDGTGSRDREGAVLDASNCTMRMPAITNDDFPLPLSVATKPIVPRKGEAPGCYYFKGWVSFRSGPSVRDWEADDRHVRC